MSKYTTELRFICERLNGNSVSADYDDVDTIITNVRGKIFSFDYPIFDTDYKAPLEKKIIRHYYTREIGMETYGLWKLFLERKMTEIMPYYNQLYLSELIKFNPLYDTDITTDRKIIGSNDGKREGSVKYVTDRDDKNKTDFDGESWNYFSDTPQGTVGNIDNLQYLTNATKNTDDNTTNFEGNTKTTTDGDTASKSSLDTTEDFLEHVTGKRGAENYSKLLRDFRKTFLNIDMLVIDELGDLFLNLW